MLSLCWVQDQILIKEEGSKGCQGKEELVVGTSKFLPVEDKPHLSCLLKKKKYTASNFRYLEQDSFCAQHLLREKHKVG